MAQINACVLDLRAGIMPLTGDVPYQGLTGAINTPLHLPDVKVKTQLGVNVKWSHVNCVAFCMQFCVVIC